MEKATKLSAYYYRQEFDLRLVRQEFRELVPFRQERSNLVYQLTSDLYLTIYSFGVAVVFGSDSDQGASEYLKRLVDLYDDVTGDAGNLFQDELDVNLNTGNPDVVGFNQVSLRNDSIEKLLIGARVLAQSVAIDYLESRIDRYLKEFDRMHTALARRGRVEASTKEVMKMIGSAGSMVNYAIAKLSLLDSPDVTWDDKEVETLFLGLRRMYDLDDRFESLSVKLEFIQGNSETMLDVLNARRSEWLEVIIIVLIGVEIIMGLAGIM